MGNYIHAAVQRGNFIIVPAAPAARSISGTPDAASNCNAQTFTPTTTSDGTAPIAMRSRQVRSLRTLAERVDRCD